MAECRRERDLLNLVVEDFRSLVAVMEEEAEALPDSERSERSRLAEEVIKGVLHAATDVPITVASRRRGNEMAEVAQLANDIEAERLPGPLIQPGAANFRLQAQRTHPRTPL